MNHFSRHPKLLKDQFADPSRINGNLYREGHERIFGARPKDIAPIPNDAPLNPVRCAMCDEWVESEKFEQHREEHLERERRRELLVDGDNTY